MHKMILDSGTSAKFDNIKDFVQLCDPGGRVLGYFTPRDDEASGKIDCPFTEEELDRAVKEPGGRPLSEILRDLERQS